ncbi:aminopeptidase [Candidatus Avelusimicrobium gallicola]|uniref:Aminopeptidase n=1 Tax=Candidatus Avelusimicrobium gallicola TaxID=2562704 RepID=A0A1Y4DA63_9BACT|nr:aminopeptidase [Elusimicrobium sp. An273]OUO56144.1 aminopeptidase [Elusimicrobium sp. An273]
MFFTKVQTEKYADVMIWALETARRNGKFKPYDTVLLRSDLSALPLARALYTKLLARHYQVIMRFNAPEDFSKTFYQHADDKQLAFIAPGEKEFQGGINGLISLRAPEDLTHLKQVDPARIAKSAVARKPLREILDVREQKGLFSWTLCNYPTEELAKRAGLSVKEYASQVARACFLNEKDPVKKWQEVTRQITEIGKWLSSLPIQTLRVETKNMDFEVLLGEKRKFIAGGGCNVPSFEIFTSPDWRGTRGVYFADLSSYRSGNYVKGVRLEFEKGRAVKADAQQGAEFVRKMLAMDKGAAQIGEFSLTDRRFSKITKFMADILYDENFGGKYGNCHVAVGSSYADTFSGAQSKLDKKTKEKLGFNDSSLHWDLINTENKTVTARLKDGSSQVIYEKGQFRY